MSFGNFAYDSKVITTDTKAPQDGNPFVMVLIDGDGVKVRLLYSPPKLITDLDVGSF